MTNDVSVVVPVYNPGKYIQPCIDSLLGQTLAASRFEVIFVDDGSTDETPAVLDRLAETHPNIRVIHQPNSGWPGKPRNVGVDEAAGEFVFFCDHDDILGAEALARMTEMARRTKADVLIPKMVDVGRPVPDRLFRRSIDRAVIGRDPVHKSGTPHKLFRRGFLVDRGIRFGEGKRRLEDAVFVMEAYLRADVISVLADYPCYYRVGRDDGGNNALSEWEPAEYFSYVEELIDVIIRYTAPGPIRDLLLIRPYEGKMMTKVVGRRLAKWSPERREQIVAEIRRLAQTRFPAGFHHSLPLIRRVHAEALLANDMTALAEVAAATSEVTASVRVTDLRWAQREWEAEVVAELTFADGSPIRLQARNGRWLLDSRLVPPSLQGDGFEIDDVRRGYVDVILRHHKSRVEWMVPTEIHPEFTPIPGTDSQRMVFRGRVILDPASVAGEGALGVGQWTLVTRLNLLGIPYVGTIRSEVGTRLPQQAALFARPEVVVKPALRNNGAVLAFRVRRAQPLITFLSRHVKDARSLRDGRFVVATDAHVVGLVPNKVPVLALVNPKGRLLAAQPTSLIAAPGGVELVTTFPAEKAKRKGEITVALTNARHHQGQAFATAKWHRSGRLVDVALVAVSSIKLRSGQQRRAPSNQAPELSNA